MKRAERPRMKITLAGRVVRLATRLGLIIEDESRAAADRAGDPVTPCGRLASA